MLYGAAFEWGSDTVGEVVSDLYNHLEAQNQEKILEYLKCLMKAIEKTRSVGFKCEIKTAKAREAIKMSLKIFLESSGKFNKKEIEILLL